MALSEIETARLKRSLEGFLARRRPPPHIRHELDLAYRIVGQSVEICEIRPRWRGQPGEKTEQFVAKATFVRSTSLWRIFWHRAHLKWSSYQPKALVGNIDIFLQAVEEDKHACFFG
jgi:hypothetical protein